LTCDSLFQRRFWNIAAHRTARQTLRPQNHSQRRPVVGHGSRASRDVRVGRNAGYSLSNIDHGGSSGSRAPSHADCGHAGRHQRRPAISARRQNKINRRRQSMIGRRRTAGRTGSAEHRSCLAAARLSRRRRGARSHRRSGKSAREPRSRYSPSRRSAYLLRQWRPPTQGGRSMAPFSHIYL
jgi:hypothetical protein